MRCGAMANHPHRRSAEVERKFVRQELAEGWLSLAAQAIFLALSTALGIVAVMHAPDAAESYLTVGSGSASLGFASLVAFMHRKRDRP